MNNNVLVVAAHPDDEVLGCGATIARHASHGDSIQVIFLADGVFSRKGATENDLVIRKQAACKANELLGCLPPLFLDFPDNQLDSVPFLKIIQALEHAIEIYKPDIIYTHFKDDLNIDHQIAFKAVMTAFRPLPGKPVKQIHSFEVPSSTEWALSNAFVPNHIVEVSDHYFEIKMAALKKYDGEMNDYPNARSYQNIVALAQYRGASFGMAKAEAFQTIRTLVRDDETSAR